jgi:8-amino-7-oxononanoate synthase
VALEARCLLGDFLTDSEAGPVTSAPDHREPSARVTRSSLDGFAGYRKLKRRLESAAQRGIEIPFFQPRDGMSGSTIRWSGRELINFSGYNYLGLSGHPFVSAAAKHAIDQYGTSASASRIVSGQIELHGELEERLAAFLGTEDCIVFVSGYLTNVTVIGYLFSRPDIVAYDHMAHNSITTGGNLSLADLLVYPRGDWAEFDRQMRAARPSHRRGLLVAEGVYSMDGAILDLERAIEAKKEHDLLLMVDEAHSLGILGASGRGVIEHTGLARREIDINMGTLSKALASCGGYIAGDKELIEHLRFLAPGFIFSVGLSPPDTAAAIAALDILEREPDRVRQLREISILFRKHARLCGLDMEGDEITPIAALVVGDTEQTILLSQRLLARGIHVQPIVAPAVAPDACRLRFFLTVNHSEEQIRATLPLVAEELDRLQRDTA